ncbi:CKLF-like MARVEL transmembrane domain-containing protein 5 isoform X4 [Anser cygnoides]|uniref:CKLF-like MARVEL transmembrane domain-containing protein 5 isoform X4 n=1 Tax=Anser cygnoides TaxID=8845 RepID=UPI0034D33ED1
MGQPQAQGLWDLGVLRTPKGRLLGAQLDLLRACSGVAVSLLVALVAIAGSRQALPVATFTFGLILALLFAYDAFATFRDDVRPLAACDPPEATTT